LQTYPYRIKSHGLFTAGYDIREINDILRDVAVRFKIPLVDNEKIFKETKDQGTGDNEGYFVADGHCNSQGYKLIAVNVYNKIIEAGILDMPHVKD
jgi:lysophospholipase L1-like esterase